jgi:hypothetical protein
MQREPLHGLFHAIVMKLVINTPQAQGFEQLRPDPFRELARMNFDSRRREHAFVLAY